MLGKRVIRRLEESTGERQLSEQGLMGMRRRDCRGRNHTRKKSGGRRRWICNAGEKEADAIVGKGYLVMKNGPPLQKKPKGGGFFDRVGWFSRGIRPGLKVLVLPDQWVLRIEQGTGRRLKNRESGVRRKNYYPRTGKKTRMAGT